MNDIPLARRGSMGRLWLAALVAALGLAVRPAPASAQSLARTDTAAQRLPFAPGEYAKYKVKLGAFTVGHGTMQILGVEAVRGRPAYHARLEVSGGIPLARVNDRFDSWFDPNGISSLRFEQDQEEVHHERYRLYQIYPELGTYREKGGDVGMLPTDQPLDDVSFLYYARTLPLEVGDTYTVPRYFKRSGNPVVLKVVRKETIEVPAGTFNTVVVQPTIQTGGLFGEGGHAEVFFTDDARHIIVKMSSDVPVMGSLSLHLEEYRPGR